MIKVLETLYEANRLGIWLWIQDDELKFKSPKNIDISEMLIKLKQNKNDILKILKLNKVFNDKIVQPFIYSIANEKCVLSFAQERLWFIEQYEEGSNAYHAPAIYELDINTDVEGLKYALKQIVSRHEILRSTIEQENEEGKAIQIVHSDSLPIEEIILTNTEEYKSLIKEDINRPFNLSKEYPIRVKLYVIQSDRLTLDHNKDKILLLINTHHIASDGWSLDIFQKELFAYYEAYINKDVNFNLPELEIQYKDYALWQRAYLKDQLLNNQLSYWKERLSGYQTLMLPTDYTRSGKKDYKGASRGFTISRETSQKLKAIAQNHSVTLNSVMLSSISILLSKYSGQEDIIIGSPIANRHHGQTEGLIGFFINTLANRIHLNKLQSFESLINQVHLEQSEAQLHQDMPFEMIVNELKVERDTSMHPIFQVMFGVQSFGKQWVGNQNSWLRSYDNLESAYEISNFDLTIYIDDANEEFEGVVVYATSLFKEETIERLITHYIYLLDQVSQFPLKFYSEISLLNQKDYNRIVYQWNETDKEYPEDKTLCQLYYEQEKKTPDNIALIFNQQKLTYKELNKKSNQLARYIRKEHLRLTGEEIVSDTFIALCFDRSLEMVIGILAVLKAGGAYVPLDPNYPQERINFIIEDTGTNLILTQRHLGKENFSKLPLKKIIYADLTEELYNEEADTNLPCVSKPNDLAYIIYTSGTTGKPKGVLTEQKAIVNKIHSLIQSHAIDSSFKIGSKIPYIFDPSLREMFITLLSGAQLIIISESLNKNTDDLVEYCIEQKINLLMFVPSHLSIFLASLKKHENEHTLAQNLKIIYSCGERLTSGLANDIKEILPNVIIKNQYGPSEVSQVSFEFDLISFDRQANKIPLGKPVKNTKAYVLDADLNIVPVGIIGELYLSGPSLARGYLNRPNLTKERFIINPFASSKEIEKGFARLYKTGDLVKWLPDGNLEYLSRNDDQIKIRGYRIELEEIERVLLQIEGIKQCCVLLKEENNNKYLVAYYLNDKSTAPINSTIIHDKLVLIIPEYMIPDVIIAVESFPLTNNGKLDKNALPDPRFRLSENEYVAPASKIEEELCGIWQEILSLDKVGIKDDFFRIGGNSISAIQVSHRMNKVLGYDIKVADVFKYKTIFQLITQCIGKTQLNIPKTNASNAVLSFAQERLWFIEQYEEGTSAYHVPFVYELDSNTNVEGIKYALQQIVSRHEILRTTIDNTGNQGEGIQNVQDKLLSIEEIILTSKDDCDSVVTEDINRPFDLSKEYPIRAKFYSIESKIDDSMNKILLLINIHHIASDGWSYFIFQRELFAYYEAYIKKDLKFTLPALEIQYKDYAVWQKNFFVGDILKKQLNYWKNKLLNFQTLEFPLDYLRPSRVDYKGAQETFFIKLETSQKLRLLAQNCGVTLYSLMLSSIGILINKYTGQNDIVVGSPNANRQYRQTEDLIGFFVNTQVNRILLKKDQNFEDLAQQVQKDQIEAQLYQDLPFEKLVDELKIERDVSRHPIFQIVFEVLSFGDQNKASEQQRNYLKNYQMGDVAELEKFDLSISIDDSEDELRGQISYATSLFQKDTIVRLSLQYISLLEQLVETPSKNYSELSLLNVKEYNQIIYEWNVTDKFFYDNTTIYELFEKQAIKTPDNIAIVYEGQELTYKELNEKGNQLARHIRVRYKERTKLPFKPDTIVALCLDRSLEMIIGIIGVLKAGGAYVPIDPTYPQERINWILEDTKAEFILSQRCLNKDINLEQPNNVIYIDICEPFYNTEDSSSLPGDSKFKDLAYVIYTSGTTGKPKGVMIEHYAIANLLKDLLEKYSIEFCENFLLFSNYIFDASIEQIFLSLLSGGKLFIIKEDSIFNVDNFIDFVTKNEITHLDATPSYLNSVDPSKFHKVKRVVFGAEYLSEQLFDKFKIIVPKIINAYGATETTINSLVSINTNLLSKVSIQNTKAYILNQDGIPVPIGVVGELYIGGAGLARGYLNLPELTKERFVNNPFASEFDKVRGYNRLYKTGDLVRWLPNGNMEYKGRNDDQVKIRGYRIESGEIENALMQIDEINQACVIVKERKTAFGSNKYLIAYYIVNQNEVKLEESIIINKLSEVLPDYMIPSEFIEISSFPLTSNGKLDKAALSNLDFKVSELEYVAPTTETEQMLCNIWKEILGLDKVGITDNFFQIGGNSILAIRLASQISKLLNFDIKIADLFRFKTINQLLIAKQVNAEFKLIKPYYNKYDKNLENIIFIHPGTAGCEVYQSIADMLSGKFNCIGIDNYNLHNEEKVGSLNKLANLYITALEKEQVLIETFYILGWSLGGSIALEMAAILEIKGYKNINVVLLDTRIPDEVSRGIYKQLNIASFLEEFRNHLIEKEYMPEYVEKVISAMDAESQLSDSSIHSHLSHTRVVLFKAVQKNSILKDEIFESMHNYYLTLAGNNIDLLTENLKIINLDCHHSNILEIFPEDIANYLLSMQIKMIENEKEKTSINQQKVI